MTCVNCHNQIHRETRSISVEGRGRDVLVDNTGFSSCPAGRPHAAA